MILKFKPQEAKYDSYIKSVEGVEYDCMQKLLIMILKIGHLNNFDYEVEVNVSYMSGTRIIHIGDIRVNGSVVTCRDKDMYIIRQCEIIEVDGCTIKCRTKYGEVKELISHSSTNLSVGERVDIDVVPFYIPGFKAVNWAYTIQDKICY